MLCGLYFRFPPRAAPWWRSWLAGPRHHRQPRNRPTMGAQVSASSFATRSSPPSGGWRHKMASRRRCRAQNYRVVKLKALALANCGPGRRRARRSLGATGPPQQASGQALLLRKLLKRQMRAAPVVMITDKLASYAAAKGGRSCPAIEHRQHKGLNNPRREKFAPADTPTRAAK